MQLKIRNFRGSFPGTSVQPTEKELLWLFNILHLIDSKEISSTFNGICGYCEKETDFTAYRNSTEDITNVDSSDWDGHTRGLQITMCNKCKCWHVVDY